MTSPFNSLSDVVREDMARAQRLIIERQNNYSPLKPQYHVIAGDCNYYLESIDDGKPDSVAADSSLISYFCMQNKATLITIAIELKNSKLICVGMDSQSEAGVQCNIGFPPVCYSKNMKLPSGELGILRNFQLTNSSSEYDTEKEYLLKNRFHFSSMP